MLLAESGAVAEPRLCERIISLSNGLEITPYMINRMASHGHTLASWITNNQSWATRDDILTLASAISDNRDRFGESC